MAVSKNEILDAISEMSVMDVVDLVKMMEDKFGVSAAAVAVAAPAAVDCAPAHSASRRTVRRRQHRSPRLLRDRVRWRQQPHR